MIDTLFIAAIQSSFILGLIHGVNPCGHSWLVLAPFITGEDNGRKVSLLTISFLGGTFLACLILGATLGSISSTLPPSASVWVETGTSIILILLGAALIIKPDLLHSHSHDHHHHSHDHHGHSHGDTCSHHHNHEVKAKNSSHGFLALSLFGIGFVNMIIPCPTAAVMYGYALNSGSALAATIVFATYAVSTAIAVGGVIYIIFRVTTMAKKLPKDWIEPLIMRLAGVIIIIFSTISLYNAI